MALSSEKKQARKDHILDIAESLIRKNGATAFTMRELADAAKVSFATPFNLLGSKDDILQGLIDRSITENYKALKVESDPIGFFFSTTNSLVQKYIKDDVYFKVLLSSVSPSKEKFEIPINSWMIALDNFFQEGIISSEFDKQQIAEHLELIFVGSAVLWMSGYLDNKAWAAQYQYSIAAALIGFIKKRDAKEQVRDFLLDAEKTLVKLRKRKS
ncbi:MAG: hypothetical protein COA99_05965 [Moraxellaceae bacterium]|nr:MAG: hypothetical protein COA99_05965 [Moraxellaceae bacterium]